MRTRLIYRLYKVAFLMDRNSFIKSALFLPVLIFSGRGLLFPSEKNCRPLTAGYVWKYFDLGNRFAVVLAFFDGEERIYGDVERDKAPLTTEKFGAMADRLWARAPDHLIKRLDEEVTTISIEGDETFYGGAGELYDPHNKRLWLLALTS